MKSTGVIRRIDELGRIVIPKEIRRTLGIREGESIEIFVDKEDIILKKYNRLYDESILANSLCELTNNVFGVKMIITDREKVMASNLNLDILNAKINEDLINFIENRLIKKIDNYTLKFNSEELAGNFIFIPIISSNDAIGLVILYSENLLQDEEIIGKLIASIFARKLDI